MDVRVLTDETIEWDAFVREAPDGSPFHLIAWKRAVQTAFGHRPRYPRAVGPTGLGGALPLLEVRGLLGGRALISVPYVVYGGICARSAEARQALLDSATSLARRLGARH